MLQRVGSLWRGWHSAVDRHGRLVQRWGGDADAAAWGLAAGAPRTGILQPTICAWMKSVLLYMHTICTPLASMHAQHAWVLASAAALEADVAEGEPILCQGVVLRQGTF